MSRGSLASPEKWHREGRGLTAEVGFITADSVQLAISALPVTWSPYHLLVVTKLKQGRNYVDMVRLTDTAQLAKNLADGEWYYFLWSPSLTPELVEPLELDFVHPRGTAVLSLSGLVNIQYQRQLKERKIPTRIGCVHKVRSDEGELVLHSEYEKIYRSLLRSLRKAAA